jgi:hypothetical protein
MHWNSEAIFVPELPWNYSLNNDCQEKTSFEKLQRIQSQGNQRQTGILLLIESCSNVVCLIFTTAFPAGAGTKIQASRFLI